MNPLSHSRLASQTAAPASDSLMNIQDDDDTMLQPSPSRKIVRMAEDSLPHKEAHWGTASALNAAARSPSIPIQHPIRRTNSELRLEQEEELADFRDYVFFTRLVQGISQQHPHAAVLPSRDQHQDSSSRLSKSYPHPPPSEWLMEQNDRCLAHIIGTRNGSLDNNNNNKIQHRSGSKDAMDYYPKYSSSSSLKHTSKRYGENPPPLVSTSSSHQQQDISASTTLAGEVFVLDW